MLAPRARARRVLCLARATAPAQWRLYFWRTAGSISTFGLSLALSSSYIYTAQLCPALCSGLEVHARVVI